MCTTNDPFITYLKQFGYSPIRLPRSNIRPRQVLAQKDRDLDWMGDLTELFVPGADAVLPAIAADQRVAEISGQRSGSLSAGVGVSILGGIIEALAGSKLGVSAGFERSKSIRFEFPEVFSDVIAPIALDKFLALSDVDPNARSTAGMLDADRLYVITSTLKARTFVVEAEAKRSGEAAVDVPIIIKDIAGGSLKVEAQGSNGNKVAFSGDTPVIFGFQAVQLFYDQGRYTAIEPLKPGTVAARSIDLAKSPIDERLRRLEPEGTFVQVNF